MFFSLTFPLLLKSCSSIVHDKYSVSKGTYKNPSAPEPLKIGDNTVNINEYAFAAFTNLNSLTLGSKVRIIAEFAFSNCSGFRGDLTIPDSVKEIGSYAFQDCGFDGTLTIGRKVEIIGAGAFETCRNLKGSINLPDTLTSLGDYVTGAFLNCNSLNGGLKLSTNPKFNKIPPSCFMNCHNLKGKLVIPSNIKYIFAAAFSGCHGFVGIIELHKTIKSVGGSTFYNCTGITNISYDDIYNPKWEVSAFRIFNSSQLILPKDYVDDEFCGIPVIKEVKNTNIQTGFSILDKSILPILLSIILFTF